MSLCPPPIPAVAALAALLLVAVPAWSAPSHDGAWLVEAATEQGPCEPSAEFIVLVANGRLRPGARDFEADGTVSRTGGVRATLSRQEFRAAVSGRLSGGQGGGTWTVEDGRCSGSWTARKQGSRP